MFLRWRSHLSRKASLFALALLGSASCAWADPGYYVVTAYDNEGQRTVDFRYWTVRLHDSSAVLWPEVGFGYGVTSRWYTEVFASFIGTMNTAFKQNTVNWQNEYLLTQGQYPIDVAIHAALIRHAYSDDGYTLEVGPVLQTDVGRTQLNLNVFVEANHGDEVSSHAQLKYQWQAKYRWRPALQFGAQGFGELGDLSHWAPADQQSNRAGPAFFGSVPVGNGQTLLYQAAYLVGKIYGARGDMFSMRVQYAF